MERNHFEVKEAFFSQQWSETTEDAPFVVKMNLSASRNKPIMERNQHLSISDNSNSDGGSSCSSKELRPPKDPQAHVLSWPSI
jgi:hypothetical protein